MIRKIFALDVRSLAFYRVCLALLVLAELAIRAVDLRAFYTDRGVLPRFLYFQELSSTWRISAYFMTGSLPVIAVLFAVTAALAILFLVGWRTRLCTFWLWFLMMSLQLRNPLVNTNADHFMRLILFWSIFMPLGAAYSLDSLRDPEAQSRPKGFFTPANIFYFLQISLIYWLAAWHKAEDSVWMKGDAVWCSLANLNATTVPGQFLLHFPSLVKFLNYAVIAFETVAPFFLFIPAPLIRLMATASFLLLQIGFGTFMYLGQFPFVSVTAMLPFIPGCFWDWLGRIQPFSAIPGGFQAFLEQGMRVGFLKAAKVPNYDVPGWSLAIGFFSILFILDWNLSILHPRFRVPQPAAVFGNLLNVEQEWGVFVPPGDFSIWFEIPGKLADGGLVDLSTNPKPDFRHLERRNFKWERYMAKLWSRKEFKNFYPYLGGYLCQEWNRKHPGPKRLVSLSLIGVYQFFYPELKNPQKILFYKGFCPS